MQSPPVTFCNPKSQIALLCSPYNFPRSIFGSTRYRGLSEFTLVYSIRARFWWSWNFPMWCNSLASRLLDQRPPRITLHSLHIIPTKVLGFFSHDPLFSWEVVVHFFASSKLLDLNLNSCFICLSEHFDCLEFFHYFYFPLQIQTSWMCWILSLFYLLQSSQSCVLGELLFHFPCLNFHRELLEYFS